MKYDLMSEPGCTGSLEPSLLQALMCMYYPRYGKLGFKVVSMTLIIVTLKMENLGY